jgi:hypothetical protein
MVLSNQEVHGKGHKQVADAETTKGKRKTSKGHLNDVNKKSKK